MRSFVVLFTLCLLVYSSYAQMVRHRSITQACHGDLMTECPTRDEQCFERHQSNAKNTVCRSWIEARASCMEYAQVHNCEKGKHRECIRATTISDLPPLCAESAYYKSLFIYLPRSEL